MVPYPKCVFLITTASATNCIYKELHLSSVITRRAAAADIHDNDARTNSFWPSGFTCRETKTTGRRRYPK